MGRGNRTHKIQRGINTEAESRNKVLYYILEQPNDPIKLNFRRFGGCGKQNETKVEGRNRKLRDNSQEAFLGGALHREKNEDKVADCQA